jgi:hypothetical protein
MRRKNDEKAQIEHHIKKQIDSARRNVAKHKREIECEKTNKWVFDDYFVYKNLADYRANDVYKWTKKSTLMSLNFNEIKNCFFILSSIIDERNYNQNLVNKSSKFNKRFVSVIQIHSSQKKNNAFVLFRYKFKSSSRLRKSFNKSTLSNY